MKNDNIDDNEEDDNDLAAHNPVSRATATFAASEEQFASSS